MAAEGENYSYPHYYLSEIYRQGGDSDEGFRHLERAVEAWPPIAEAHYQLALMLVERDKLGQADYHFGRAARLRGDFAGALRSFTRAQSRLGTDPVWSTRIAEELWRMQ
jgi:tetratricopeptide (TPR) repeat protein